MSVVNVERPQGRDEVGRLKRPVASLAEDERLAIGERLEALHRGEEETMIAAVMLRQMFDDYQIPYGPRADVIINNRDYETSENGHMDFRM
jgi:hypothetical protein